jgi:hypothetical protein
MGNVDHEPIQMIVQILQTEVVEHRLPSLVDSAGVTESTNAELPAR